MRIGLAYDLQTDPADPRQAEFDPPETIRALRAALETLGHQVEPLGSALDLLHAPERLSSVDLVFNIAEGESGRCREAWLPMLLEMAGVPYVGSDPLALMVGLDKVHTKQLAVADGVPTPRWFALEHPRRLPKNLPLSFPVIVKPRHEGSGIGIDAGAVVHTPEALAARAAWLFEQVRQPLLIEEFIPTGELTVCIIGHEPAVAYPAIQRPIDPASRLSCHVIDPTPEDWECPLTLDAALDAGARAIALTMFNATACRDMARVDLRVDDQGQLYFLEINPLPSFDPAGSLGLLADYLGTTYASLIGLILQAASKRLGEPLTVGSLTSLLDGRI